MTKKETINSNIQDLMEMVKDIGDEQLWHEFTKFCADNNIDINHKQNEISTPETLIIKQKKQLKK